MALRPYQPPGPPHQFDIVAYDGFDRPFLVVETKRNGDIRKFDQIVRDTEYYIAHSRRPAPFFLIANPEKIYLFKRDGGDTLKPAHEFNAVDVLRRYDESIRAVVQSLSIARLFEIDHQTATRVLFAPIIAKGAADNLILYAILDDATSKPASDMASFTLNLRDFAGAAAIAILQGANVALLKDSPSTLMWLRT